MSDQVRDKKEILIIAEQNRGKLHPVSYELLNKAAEWKQHTPSVSLSCLLLAPEGAAAEELNFRGAEVVYYMQSEGFTDPEELVFKKNIVAFILEHSPETILIGATPFGRSLAPRIAAALTAGLTADCTDLQMDEDGRLVQIRPAFSDNIFAHIKTATNPQMATVRYKEFSEARRNPKLPVHVVKIKPYFQMDCRSVVLRTVPLGEGDITDAEVVVAGGRGLRKKEDLALLLELADVLGGQVGVSRALVDAGMAPSSRQVGYSGSRVKPKIYIACGISGAPQHLAGMKESGIIIAVNSDPSAPIFKIADYGYVGDLYEVVPRMIRAWKKEVQQ